MNIPIWTIKLKENLIYTHFAKMYETCSISIESKNMMIYAREKIQDTYVGPIYSKTQKKLRIA